MRLAAISALVVIVIAASSACGGSVAGESTSGGATAEDVVLTADDFPAGVLYGRMIDDPGRPDGDAPAMLSKPEGCSDALMPDISGGSERSPDSSAKYTATYDGARIEMTVLTHTLDLDKLAAAAQRCAEYQTFSDPTSPPIPMTTTRVAAPRPDALVYEQTMDLNGVKTTSIYSFENVHGMAAFGVAFPTPNLMIPVKAALPQTFLTIAGKQAERLQAA
jgi:hypothetical protein